MGGLILWIKVFFVVDSGPDGFVPVKNILNEEDYEEDEEDPPPVEVDDVTAKELHNQAKHVVARVLSATNRLVASFLEDPSRPGSSLSALLDGVNIVYTMEQQQLVHRPNTIFKEQWLEDILFAKRLLFESGAQIVLDNEDPLLTATAG